MQSNILTETKQPHRKITAYSIQLQHQQLKNKDNNTTRLITRTPITFLYHSTEHLVYNLTPLMFSPLLPSLPHLFPPLLLPPPFHLISSPLLSSLLPNFLMHRLIPPLSLPLLWNYRKLLLLLTFNTSLCIKIMIYCTIYLNVIIIVITSKHIQPIVITFYHKPKNYPVPSSHSACWS